jgi:hypothetical protein
MHIFPRPAFWDGGGYDKPGVVPSWLSGEVCARARTVFAKREMLAASGRKHGAQDALARLAEQ